LSSESTPLFALFLGGLLALSPGFGSGQKQVDYLQVVKQATPAIGLTSSANPVPVSTPVTFTAVLGGSGATPSGTVAFFDGATQLCTCKLDGNGIATFSTSSLAIGSHSIVASYEGEANYLPVASMALVVSVVNPPPVVLTLAATSITTAQSLTVEVAVNGGNAKPVPTGTVVLSGGGYTSAPTVLVKGGTSIVIPAGSLPAGSVALTVRYTPDSSSSANYSSSFGVVSVMVTPATQTGYFMLSHDGSIAVSPGATTGNTLTITVTPSAGFTGQVNLACSVTTSLTNPTSPPTCTLGAGGTSTSSVTIAGNGAVSTTLAVQTTAATNNASRPPMNLHLGGGSAALACFMLFCIPSWHRRWRNMLGLLLFLVALAGSGIIACGGNFSLPGGNGNGNSGTTPGAYTVTVTGTVGATAVTTVVNLTVQ
jgi:hypothetical protein